MVRGRQSASSCFEPGLMQAVPRRRAVTALHVSRREIRAGTIWTNTWAAINDGFAEGGYKASGVGRLRGSLAITEFEEAKTIVHSIPLDQA
jgi:betaine-aldehyde dehydrogenase